MMQLLFSLLTACVAAPLAAWLTARFALRRFYSEKVWERKTATYTAIFDALHDLTKWFTEHQLALETDRDLPGDVSQKLAAESREAKARLARQLDRESWLLPIECSKRLTRMQRELENSSTSTDWVLYLEAGWMATDSALRDLRILVRDDLGIDRQSPIERICEKFKRLVSKLI